MTAKNRFYQVPHCNGGGYRDPSAAEGFEAAWALCRRGYEIAVAEGSTEIGGRVALESRLPGLSAWG